MNKFFPVHLHVLWLRKHAFDHQEVAANFTKNGHKLWCKILDEERRNKRQMTRDKKGTRQDMGKICNREPMGGNWQQAGGKMKLAIRIVIYPHPCLLYTSDAADER